VLPGSTVYELDAEPHPGQKMDSWQGRPVQFKCWFMSVGHSDECYRWTPPEEAKDGEEGHTHPDR
jgi:hypothetical protein